jgi:mRNA interferase RelE/StbE
MYRIRFRGKADKQIQKIPPPHFQRIQKQIEALKNDPRPLGAKQLEAETGYRVRVGDYRILYNVDDEKREVIVYRVKHRREVYRRP